ncbi:unnamed protein product [Phytophthora lilii]|uniref:Unnamed protein product n=1 Tax=Phytophthora lilii TaxID=2077276 RepID=A0A9W6UEH8_9STRA|nr:unnamed protein product [Phytophthora lilii]
MNELVKHAEMASESNTIAFVLPARLNGIEEETRGTQNFIKTPSARTKSIPTIAVLRSHQSGSEQWPT